MSEKTITTKRESLIRQILAAKRSKKISIPSGKKGFFQWLKSKR